MRRVARQKQIGQKRSTNDAEVNREAAKEASWAVCIIRVGFFLRGLAFIYSRLRIVWGIVVQLKLRV